MVAHLFPKERRCLFRRCLQQEVPTTERGAEHVVHGHPDGVREPQAAVADAVTCVLEARFYTVVVSLSLSLSIYIYIYIVRCCLYRCYMFNVLLSPVLYVVDTCCRYVAVCLGFIVWCVSVTCSGNCSYAQSLYQDYPN